MRALSSGSSGLANGKPTITTKRPSSSLKLIPSLSLPPHTHSMTAPVRVPGFAAPAFAPLPAALAIAAAKSRSAFSTFDAVRGSRNTALDLAIWCNTPVFTHRAYTSSAYLNDGKNTTTPPGTTAHALATSRPSSSIISGAPRDANEKSNDRPVGPAATAMGRRDSRGTT